VFVQVLTPVKSYAMGVTELNHTLQELFNPPDKDKVQLSRSGKPSWVWRVGDRVTHLKNDTHLDVYNGDQGYIGRNSHVLLNTVLPGVCSMFA
jgi:exodeoxyribonuclease V alpha subunit